MCRSPATLFQANLQQIDNHSWLQPLSSWLHSQKPWVKHPENQVEVLGSTKIGIYGEQNGELSLSTFAIGTKYGN